MKYTKKQFLFAWIAYIAIATVAIITTDTYLSKWFPEVNGHETMAVILPRIVLILTCLILAAWGFACLVNTDSYDYVEELLGANKYAEKTDMPDSDRPHVKKRNYTIYLMWFLVVVFIYNGFKLAIGVTSNCATLYNNSIIYHNNYIQKVQEKRGFYDKLWKTYLQKEKITNMNKDMFILVSKIIMENRKDGKNISWKWVRENQQIPYEEFTKFYVDLSNFIESQREAYFSIEKVCQGIANSNNTMLDTFPNNFYNKIVKCQKINFEYGFLSDSTDVVFKSKKENLK